MEIEDEFDKVLKIGDVFREEDSKKKSKLNEFVGMDLEMDLK
jgi:aspartyl/asparaginyl-tRNA synthetase